MSWKTIVVGALATVAGAALLRWQLAGRFVDEPSYEIERSLGEGMEVRRYAPRVLAVTRVGGGSRDAAVNEGFRRLAGYIFGGNRARRSVAMTAPVLQAAASEEVAMTAPVLQAAAGGGGWVISFVMPPGSTLEALPVPDDDRVVLEVAPSDRIAVLRYSGSAGPEQWSARAQELRGALAREGLVEGGEPVSARYDPPWTLPMLRRNEVWLSLGAAR